jgi:hypothetical protein
MVPEDGSKSERGGGVSGDMWGGMIDVVVPSSLHSDYARKSCHKSDVCLHLFLSCRFSLIIYQQA